MEEKVKGDLGLEEKNISKNRLVIDKAIKITSVINDHLSEEKGCRHSLTEVIMEALDY